jgi:hypothetical protein
MPIDYKKYPSNWLSEIRPRILKRAKNKCECCKKPNGSFPHSYKNSDGKTVWEFLSLGQWYFADCPKTVKVVLTIAHLDHDEHNHNVTDDRLKAMCQLCHLNYDIQEKRRRKLECLQRMDG